MIKIKTTQGDEYNFNSLEECEQFLRTKEEELTAMLSRLNSIQSQLTTSLKQYNTEAEKLKETINNGKY